MKRSRKWYFLSLLVLPLLGMASGCDSLATYLILSTPTIVTGIFALLGTTIQTLTQLTGVGLLAVAICLSGCAETRSNATQDTANLLAAARETGWSITLLGNGDLSGDLKWSPFGFGDLSKSSIIVKAVKIGRGKTKDFTCCWLQFPEQYLKEKGLRQLMRDAAYLLAAGDDQGYGGSVTFTLDPSTSMVWTPFGIVTITKSAINFDIQTKQEWEPRPADESTCPWYREPLLFRDAYNPNPSAGTATQPAK